MNGDVMNFLGSPAFSAVCAAVNLLFAINSFSNGSPAFGILGLLLAGFCFNNYLKTR